MNDYLKMSVQLLVLLIVFIFGIAVIFSNYQTLIYPLTFKLKLFNWSTVTKPVEVFWVLIITFVCGMLVTMAISLFGIIKLRSQLARRGREIKELKKEVRSLKDRVMPLTAAPMAGEEESLGLDDEETATASK